MNKRILIVRGDQQNAKALSFLLAGSGYQISSHATAEQAIEAAKQERFDLAITDATLPENQSNLGLVANLKEAQPSLPVFFLANEENLETVINCIRAGVTEVIQDPTDIKGVIEMTNSFLKSDSDDVVSWEDMIEVERVLESCIYSDKEDADGSEKSVSSVEVEKLKAKLEEALQERDKMSGELAGAVENLQKSKLLIDELRSSTGTAKTESEIDERAYSLDERERSLKELSDKITRQKADVETELGELDAQRIEIEEAQNELLQNSSSTPENLLAIEKEFEKEKAELVKNCSEMQECIKKLEAELEEERLNPSNALIDEEGLNELKEELQDSQDLIKEKDFLIEQRDREIEELKEAMEASEAEKPLAQEIDDEKRLIEIERHKLQEKRDQLELERRAMEDEREKNQREIQVERKDAEVSLRELQHQIKEEQLKMKVDQATLREEVRQFDQAKQNFLEDVQELQSKQVELKKMEAYLQEMEETIKSGATAQNALPRPDDSAMEPISEQPTDPDPAENAVSEESEIPEAELPKEATKDGKPGKPDSWGKPDFEKKKGGRGPLRIGRRSSF